MEIPAESNLQVYKEEAGWFEKITKLKRYFRTRQAILDKENLFDLTEEELNRRDLMGPLRFNIYQTILSSLPTSAILWCVTFLHPEAAVQQPAAGSPAQVEFAHLFPGAFSTDTNL